MIRIAAGVLSLMLALPALAAEPVSRQVPCPVGGPPIPMIGAQGCQHLGRVFLSLRPRTNCEYVTRLPVCPASGFPVHRDFRPQELPGLRRLVDSAGFAQIRSQHNRFYLAHWVARQIGDDNARGELNLLMGGIWYETEAALADRSHLAETRAVLDRLLPETQGVERAMLTGLGSWISMRLEDWGDGQARLARMRFMLGTLPGEDAAAAEEYATLLARCAESGDATGRACAPFLER